MSITVSIILQRKGALVHKVEPHAPVSAVAEALDVNGVGALVVTTDGTDVVGIVSERDVVRALAWWGQDCLHEPVARIMTEHVRTCDMGTSVDELMAVMTQERVRHVPVLDEGVLAGIVSIGDVVKARLDELEVQTEAMQAYVSGSPG
jgi:signal-transduction protein with cAMP-binding, CBS, and nucleotidyltransferase domain